MKYGVSCPKCGEKYEVELSFAPCFCLKCGSNEAVIESIKSKARLRAEEAMCKMDSLKPRIFEARKVYMDLMAEYEVECQIIRGYARRDIVTPEEKDRYMIRKSEELKRVTLTQCLEDRWKEGRGK